MGTGKPIDEIADLWRRRIESARKQAKRLRGRYLELRYEDLITDPEQVLRRVCELVELDYDPAMLSYREQAERRISELGDLAAEGARDERDRDERQAAHSLAAKPPTEARIEVWREDMDSSRPGRVRPGRRRSASRTRLRRAILIGPPWPSTIRSGCFAIAACAAARSPSSRPRSWSASDAPEPPCCG